MLTDDVTEWYVCSSWSEAVLDVLSVDVSCVVSELVPCGSIVACTGRCGADVMVETEPDEWSWTVA